MANVDPTQAQSFPAAQGGIFRRKIALSKPSSDLVFGWLEDDFHHFGISLSHDGKSVLDIGTTTVRFPWTTCSESPKALEAIIGKPLVARGSDIGGIIDMRSQCTHLFDLAGLLVALAANHHRGNVIYEVAVQVDCLRPGLAAPVGDAPAAQLTENGSLVMAWQVHEDVILRPKRWKGRSLSRGFRTWTEALPPIEAERATVLRRSLTVARGRLDCTGAGLGAATWSGPPLCYSLNAARFPFTSPSRHQQLDFSADNRAMLAHPMIIPSLGRLKPNNAEVVLESAAEGVSK